MTVLSNTNNDIRHHNAGGVAITQHVSEGESAETEELHKQNLEFAAPMSTVLVWASVSRLLWWTVLIVTLVSLPILVFTAFRMFHRYRKSVYFHFLATMTCINFLMLLIILVNVLTDEHATAKAMPLIVAVRGDFTCKFTTFFTNMLSCYSNWLWVMMFAQRYVNIFFPFGSRKRRRLFMRLLDNSFALITGTGLVSIGTQLWTPFLMHQIILMNPDGTIHGSFCGPDEALIGQTFFKWIAAAESIWTYAIPFCVTLCTDVAVLVLANEKNRFAVLPSITRTFSRPTTRKKESSLGNGGESSGPPSLVQHHHHQHETCSCSGADDAGVTTTNSGSESASIAWTMSSWLPRNERRGTANSGCCGGSSSGGNGNGARRPTTTTTASTSTMSTHTVGDDDEPPPHRGAAKGSWSARPHHQPLIVSGARSTSTTTTAVAGGAATPAAAAGRANGSGGCCSSRSAYCSASSNNHISSFSASLSNYWLSWSNGGGATSACAAVAAASPAGTPTSSTPIVVAASAAPMPPSLTQQQQHVGCVGASLSGSVATTAAAPATGPCVGGAMTSRSRVGAATSSSANGTPPTSCGDFKKCPSSAVSFDGGLMSHPLLKIQTEASVRKSMARRQHAIRRCLALATMQLCLNLPNYILQLVDEFTNLRSTSERYVEFYLWADALFYLLYLSQYPMIAIYVDWFHPKLANAGAPSAATASTPSTPKQSCCGGVGGPSAGPFVSMLNAKRRRRAFTAAGPSRATNSMSTTRIKFFERAATTRSSGEETTDSLRSCPADEDDFDVVGGGEETTTLIEDCAHDGGNESPLKHQQQHQRRTFDEKDMRIKLQDI